MSVACTIEVAPSRRVRIVRAAGLAVPAAGLALAALRIAAGPTAALDADPGVRASVAVVLACAALALALAAALEALGGGRSGRAFAVRSIAVDEAGAAILHGAPGSAPTPAGVVRWCGLPGLTLLVLAPYPTDPGVRPRPVALLLGRDGMSDTAWRRLNVWLRWLDRGPADPRPPGPHP